MPKITSFLWFDCQAEEASAFYTSIFPGSKILSTIPYSEEVARSSGRPPGSAMTVSFRLGNQEFTALNGGPHFNFNEAVSFVVHCDSQNELDYYWDKLSAGGDPQAQQCGWLKDRFGVSWQIVPASLPDLLKDPAKAPKVMEAVLKMKKLEIAVIEKAAD